MLNPPTNPLTFYPAYCFSLSPTYHTWARLTANDVNALQEHLGFEGQNLYFHLNHPIKWVRLVGLIVSFELISNRYILILDDFSGVTLELTCTRKVPPPRLPNTTSSVVQTENTSEEANETRPDGVIPSMEVKTPLTDTGIKGVTANGYDVDLSNVDIGSIVKVKGGIGEFRGQKQILLERIWVVKTTAEEAAAWAENLEFRRTVLAKPWTVTEEDMKGARREAEGLSKDGESKRRRKKVKGSRSGSNAGRHREKLDVTNKHLGKGTRKSGAHNEQRRRKAADQERIDEQEKKAKVEDERRRIEHEDAQRRERKEALRRMKDDQERRRRVEEEQKRRSAEEKERLAAERRRRNEAREKALQELGAGR